MLNQYRFHSGQFPVSFAEFVFTGTDVESFFQNQSTFDVKKISNHAFHLASFLDPQGRVECYGWLLKSIDQYIYLVPKKMAEATEARLNKFLISEDVEIKLENDQSWVLVIGPDAQSFVKSDWFAGEVFAEEAYLYKGAPSSDIPMIETTEVQSWQGLTGWPSFDGSDYSFEIINNLRLYDLSVAPNKGCYPGQETVSKIATRRGAAYNPVLLEVGGIHHAGDLFSFDKKIGKVTKNLMWQGRFYLAAELLRDFRVEGLKLHCLLNEKELDGVVRYYPLLKGSRREKAEELFYLASDHFTNDELKLAEEKFRLAIKIDPTYADAYESLGVMLGREERFQEAIELMEKLSQVDPKSVMAHTNMSLYLMRLGKIEEAEEQKSQATLKSFQKFGDEAKSKELEKAQTEAKLSEWAQRESMFNQVLEIDPEDTLANFGLGSIAVERADWSKARDHLERVIKEDPKYSVAYLALGKAYQGLGEKEKARSTWQEGIKVAAAKGDLMPANQMQQELSLL